MVQDVFLRHFGKMIELMLEPAWVLSNQAVDRTETETATFLWDSNDPDSDVVLTRDTEYDVANLVVSHTAWSVANGPTISDVVTDADDDATIPLTGATTLTITGTNYGAEDTDLEVWVYVQQAKGAGHSHPTSGRADGRLPVKATIMAVNGGDTEITASLVLPRNYGGRNADPGACEVEVRNIKRFLKTPLWSGLSVIKV